MSTPTPSRRHRRWWKVVGLVLGLVAALVGILPGLIAGPFRSRVAAGLNRALSPGRVEFEGLQVSWLGPTRLDRVNLLDPKGRVVLRSPSLALDKTLGQLILRDRSPAVLTLEGAALDVERSEDGIIDVAQALRTLIASPDPARDVTVRVVGGSIRYRDPFLAEPAVADSLDLTIHAPYAPAPVTWSAKLARGDAGLDCQGDFDAWLSKGGPPRAPELQIAVVGRRWPFVARTAGLAASGRLVGSLDFARKRGRWVFSGDASLEGLEARGKALEGDALAIDRLEAGWDLAEGEDAWKIRRLSASCPLGQLRAEGQLGGLDGSGKQRVEGQVDLAEVARRLPHALHLREGLVVDKGTARVAVDLTSGAGRSACEIEARVSDLSARDRDRPLGLKDPATFQASLVRDGGESRVDRLSVHTSFLDASARGRLDEGIAISGAVDLDGLRKQVGDWFDLGKLGLSGRAQVSGTYRVRPATPGYVGRWTADFKDLRVDDAGPWSTRLDSGRVEVNVAGPSGPSGFPGGWERLGLLAESGKSSGRVDLETAGGPIHLSASASTPWRVGDRTRLAKLEASGDWAADRRSLAFDRIQAILGRADGRSAGPPVAVACRGRLDLESGELVLESAAGDAAGSLSIDADGLRVAGLGRGLEDLRLEGGFSGDLGPIDQLLAELAGRSPLGLTGRWSAIVNARGDADGVAMAGKLGLVDAPRSAEKEGRPAGLALRAHYSPKGDRLDLSEFTVSSAYGTLDASGKLEEVSGERRVDLKGMLSPDFGAISGMLASRVEPGARVEGRPRPFRASGPINGEGSGSWRGLDAELGFDLAGADIYGMKFGPSPVILRARRGRLALDPIGTTLNEGHVRLEPEVDLDAPGGPALRLAKNSGIREARINDEVSRRVLAYVAPILDQATTARGLVSVDLDHAEFPLGPGRGRQAKVEGAVVFQDVEFAPGPLAGEILGAIGRRDLTLKLDQPVTLTIADGRVRQRGMSIPIGELTRVELDGWVDFDRNIALNASVPVTAAMLGNNPLLSDIAAGTKVRLPISGTLDRPEVDREAFAGNLRDLGKSLLTRGATRGALELLMRLARPKDPDAPPTPPRPSPAERKAMRQEKKAIRRGEVPPPPADPRP